MTHLKRRNPRAIFEKDPLITAQADAVFEAMASYDKGSIVPWSVVEEAMGCPHDTHRGRHVVNRRVKPRLLAERDICCWPEFSVGIRLLTNEETAKEQMCRRQLRAARQIRRGLMEAATVDDALLSEGDRDRFHKRVQAMEEQARVLRYHPSNWIGKTSQVET